MRILFVNKDDIFSKNTWSGIPYFIFKNLKENASEVDYLSPVEIKRNIVLIIFFKAIKRIIKLLTGYDNVDFYEYVLMPKKLNKKIENYLKTNNNYDAIITTSFIPFVYYSNKIPLIIITDATIKKLYEDYNNYSLKQYYFIQKQSIKATNNASLIISSSEYISDAIVNNYELPESKVRTIPFGANFSENENYLRQRNIDKSKTIKFLFVGRDFYRKGGDIAIEICDKLKLKGINLKLSIAGTKIPKEHKRDYIENYIYLNKEIPEENKILIELYNNAHFFIMPSRAEMYGIVFCEAASLGLPVITSNRGGITQIVKDNETGIVMDLESGFDKYIERINELINDNRKYQIMSINSGKRYSDILNWGVFIKNLLNEISGLNGSN